MSNHRADSPLEDYVSMFDINVLGTIRLTLAALPLLRAGSKKVIFNVSSILGSNSLLLEQGVVFAHAPFSVSKAALNMFNTKLAKEIAAEGLITVTIRPGFVDTDKNEGPSMSYARFVRMYVSCVRRWCDQRGGERRWSEDRPAQSHAG